MFRGFLSDKKKLFDFGLVALFLFAISYFFLGKASYGANGAPYFNDIEFFIFGCLLLCINSAILFVSIKIKEIEINKWLAMFCLFFFLTSLISIIGFSGVNFEGEIIGKIGFVSKLRSVFLSFLLFYSIYIILSIIPRYVADLKIIKLVFYLAIFIAVIAIIYSFIFEGQIYNDFFNNNVEEAVYALKVPQSFTGHRNVYGFILFAGMIGEGYLEIEKPHWWRLPLMSFFLLQQFFTFSKTCMILGTFFLAFIFVYSLTMNLRKNNYTHALFLGIYIVILSIIIVVCLFANFSDSPFAFITNYSTFLKSELFNMFSASMHSRETSWTLPMDATGNTSLFSVFFGFGYGNEYHALGAYAFGDSNIFPIIDNAWGLMFAQNGVFGMAYGSLLWAIGPYLIYKSFRRNKQFALFYLAVYLCLLGRTFTENDTLSYLDYSGTAYFCLLYLPLLVEEVNSSLEKRCNLDEI